MRRALLLCLAGVALALVLAPNADVGPALRVAPPAGWIDPSGQGSLFGRYLRLDNWDSLHFVDIAIGGYRAPETVTREDVHNYRANVTFLPAYPIAVGARCQRWLRQNCFV